MSIQKYITVLALMVMTACVPYATTAVPVHHDTYLGGANWRVYDVDEIDSIEYRYALKNVYNEVVECLGGDYSYRNYENMRIFTAAGISQKFGAEWMWVLGRWDRVTDGIYIIRGLSNQEAKDILMHETAHYLTQLSHTAIDPKLIACGIPLTVEHPATPMNFRKMS